MEDQNQQPISSEETTTEKTSPETTSTEPVTPSEAPADAMSQVSAPIEPVVEAPAPAPITPAPAPAPAPVAAPKVVAPVIAPKKPAPVVQPKAVAAVVEDFPKVTGFAEVDRLLKNVPAASQTGILRMMDYIEAMHPKRPMDDKAGSRHQVSLYKVLQNTINREDEHFRALFGAILALFEVEPTGVFKEVNVFRFMDQVELPESDRKAFQRLLNLIKVMGPKAGRAQAIKQVSFDNSLRFGLTEQGRQRVLDYFGVGA